MKMFALKYRAILEICQEFVIELEPLPGKTKMTGDVPAISINLRIALKGD